MFIVIRKHGLRREVERVDAGWMSTKLKAGSSSPKRGPIPSSTIDVTTKVECLKKR